MTALELKDKLTRKMGSGDFCYQRIFHCMPALWRQYSEYMTETKIYNFADVFLLLVTDWNKERIADIKQKYSSKKIDLAINEVIHLYDTISTICDNFTEKNELHIKEFEKFLKIDLRNYKDISSICKIYSEEDNFSKLTARMNTLSKKTKKTLNGVITFESFIKNEVIPQKEFLDIFVERLKMFDKDQFCIFMLCYDIKKTHKAII